MDKILLFMLGLAAGVTIGIVLMSCLQIQGHEELLDDGALYEEDGK